ncbi:MAG: pyridoxal phosphate-dependent aminotransferase family protein [Thermoguttaceae bacterium]|nr:pyridoxal phosphate-dependent aminotransferase family protein [Thermoguttaceae bacterium]
MDAFESRWNAKIDGAERKSEKRGEAGEFDAAEGSRRAGRSEVVGSSDRDDAEDRAEFERLRRLAGDLVGRENGERERAERETERRKNVAKAFAEPSIRNVAKRNARSNRVDAERESVENAFRLDGPPDATATIDGKTYVYFGGDGYLGLQADPEMLATACEAAMKYGLASATSRRCFVPAPARDVERNAAEFFGVERAFYSLSETATAEATLRLLDGSFDRVFVDEASAAFWRPLLEKLGCGRRGESAASVWTPILFRRCDAVDLAEKLRNNLPNGARPLVVVDGVFADCGSISPLDRYERALRRHSGAALLVDDSHGVGVLGERGRGTLEHCGLDLSRVNATRCETEFEPEAFDDDPFAEFEQASSAKQEGVRLYMFASLAKAVGGFGCVAPGSESFVEKLGEVCEEICGAIPSNPIAAATARGLRILTTTPDLRTRLRENADRLRSGLRALGFDVEASPSPVVSLRVGTPQNMRRIQRTLANERILISFLPTCGDGRRGALRIAVFATHSPEMIDALVEKLRETL